MIVLFVFLQLNKDYCPFYFHTLWHMCNYAAQLGPDYVRSTMRDERVMCAISRLLHDRLHPVANLNNIQKVSLLLCCLAATRSIDLMASTVKLQMLSYAQQHCDALLDAIGGGEKEQRIFSLTDATSSNQCFFEQLLLFTYFMISCLNKRNRNYEAPPLFIGHFNPHQMTAHDQMPMLQFARTKWHDLTTLDSVVITEGHRIQFDGELFCTDAHEQSALPHFTTNRFILVRNHCDKFIVVLWEGRKLCGKAKSLNCFPKQRWNFGVCKLFVRMQLKGDALWLVKMVRYIVQIDHELTAPRLGGLRIINLDAIMKDVKWCPLNHGNVASAAIAPCNDEYSEGKDKTFIVIPFVKDFENCEICVNDS